MTKNEIELVSILRNKKDTLASVGIDTPAGKQKLVNYIKILFPHFGNKVFEMAYIKGLYGYTFGGVSGIKLNAIVLLAAGYTREAKKLYREWRACDSEIWENKDTRKVRIVELSHKPVILCKSFNKGANSGSGADILFVENGHLTRTRQTYRRGEITAIFSEYRTNKVGRKLSNDRFYYYC